MASRSIVRPGSQVLLADYLPRAGFGPRQVCSHEFVWLLRGSATWRVEEHRLPGQSPQCHEQVIRPGTLLLTPRGNVDSYRWDADAVSTHAYIHFDLDPEPTPTDSWAWPRTRRLGDHPLLRGILEQLLTLAGRDDQASRHRTDQLVDLLWDCFVHDPVLPPGSQAAPAVVEVFDYAHRLWQVEGVRIISAAELAEAANLSVSHLFRTFRTAYGCGPVRALELIRLARAAVALQRTNDSLAEIARQCGFANAYHFSRRFARTYGQPPGSYRALGTGADPLEPVRAAALLDLALPLLTSMSEIEVG